MSENMNINVDKKKKNVLIPLILIIIIIAIGIIGIVLSGNKGATANNTKASEEQKEPVISEEERIKAENEKKVNEVYARFPKAKWASKGEVENPNIFRLKDGKIVYDISNKEVIKDVELTFKNGTPKYLTTILNGGIPYCVSVLTAEGEVYNVYLKLINDAWGNGIDENKTVCIKQKIDEKVIDFATYIDDYVNPIPRYNPYYLTETGKLYANSIVDYSQNSSYKTFDELNRDHIIMFNQRVSPVFVNKDKTIEALRNANNYEYTSIIDEKGEKIIAKYIFCIDSMVYYVVNENSEVYTFSFSNSFVASRVWKEKEFEGIKYSEKERQVEITFKDESKVIEKNVGSFYDLSK